MANAFVTDAKGIDAWDGSTANTQATAAWNLSSTGRLICVGIRWTFQVSAVTVTGVADTAGNVYVDSGVGAVTLASNSGYMQFYYCKSTTATSATNVVTATFSGVIDYKSVMAAEYSGADTTAPLDVTASGTNPGALTVTSGSFTPTTATGVSVAYCAHGPAETGTFTAGTNYTKRDTTVALAGDHLCLEDRLLSPASAQTAGGTSSANFWWGIIVVNFKAAGTAGGDTLMGQACF